jgi:hypothetical protein
MRIRSQSDHPSAPPLLRRRVLLGSAVTVFVAMGVVLTMSLTRKEAETLSKPRDASRPVDAPTTTRTPEEKDRIADRLREILRIREEAYRLRDPGLLFSIYSNDCPCLKSDESAIQELIDLRQTWDGISTSVSVKSVQRIDERLWTVVALFESAALRIETEDGKLVRTESGGSDVFRFTLVKPRESRQWMLGLASVVED